MAKEIKQSTGGQGNVQAMLLCRAVDVDRHVEHFGEDENFQLSSPEIGALQLPAVPAKEGTM